MLCLLRDLAYCWRYELRKHVTLTLSLLPRSVVITIIDSLTTIFLYIFTALLPCTWSLQLNTVTFLLHIFLLFYIKLSSGFYFSSWTLIHWKFMLLFRGFLAILWGRWIECFTSLGCILVVSSVCLRGKMLITFDEIVNFVILIHEVNV